MVAPSNHAGPSTPPSDESREDTSVASRSNSVCGYQTGSSEGLRTTQSTPLPAYRPETSASHLIYNGTTCCSTPTPEYDDEKNPESRGPKTSSMYAELRKVLLNDALRDEKKKDVEETVKEKGTTYTSGHTITNFEKKYDNPCFELEKLADHDDGDMLPRWKKLLFRFGPLFTFLSQSAYLLYFAFRIYFTVSAQKVYHRTYVMAWLFISAEGLVAAPTLFHNAYSLLAVRGRNRPKLRLRGTEIPTVDVLITCCKEDVDVVLDTARAACAVDYPVERFRVIVCDDGADPAIRKAIEILSQECPNLYYHARVKIPGVPHHFKAGNLIDATNLVATMPGGAGEYLAALDADMIPEVDWLRGVIAHLVNDPKMALACPPQQFYNIPDNDPLVQSLDGFAHVMEPTKDANGVAWCTGSGYIIRRSALESIGGWPTGSLAEDVCTSSMLLGAGWKTAFVHEPLQFGLVPDTYTAHLKQRTRWTIGTLQTAMKLNLCLFGKDIRKMTIFQRLSGFVFTIDAFFKTFLLLALLTVPIVLVSGGTMVAYANSNQLRWQIRLCLISIILTRLNEWIAFLPGGYRLTQRDSRSQIWMAPYHAMTIFQAFILPKWLGGKSMAFSPSGSVKCQLNERDAETRAPLWRRLKFIVWDCKSYIHLMYVAFVVTAVVLSITRAFNYHRTWDILMYLLTHAFWPPVLWLMCVSAACVPVRYAIWPPNMPDREELLDRDEKTQIARPKEEWKKQRWAKTSVWTELQYTACTIYTAVVFFGSFWV